MFEVIWREEALDELADTWVQSDPLLRPAIEAAVVRLNARLAAEPIAVGESRGDELHRIAFDPPVVVTFAVETKNRIVRVHHFRAG